MLLLESIKLKSAISNTARWVWTFGGRENLRIDLEQVLRWRIPIDVNRAPVEYSKTLY